MKAFNRRMGPVIQQHQGFISQYLGDGIMAIFPEAPQTALQAAIGMQEALTGYNVERMARGRQAIRVGIGLHTGPLIMGIIGDEERMDAATIADTVNTASRIEGLTKYYGVNILVSDTSREKLDDTDFRYLGKVQVKGKKEPIAIYECFSGDPSDLAAKKLKTLHDFETGLDHFFAREFGEASAAFERVLKGNAEDQTARLFLHKSNACQVNGIPDDWTGVEVMRFK